jgi:hypothetical protein
VLQETRLFQLNATERENEIALESTLVVLTDAPLTFLDKQGGGGGGGGGGRGGRVMVCGGG